jgi:hypothetical protein
MEPMTVEMFSNIIDIDPDLCPKESLSRALWLLLNLYANEIAEAIRSDGGSVGFHKMFRMGGVTGKDCMDSVIWFLLDADEGFWEMWRTLCSQEMKDSGQG